jgi:hypothetical protein
MSVQNPFTLAPGIGIPNCQIYGANANLVSGANIIIYGNTQANSNTSGALQIAGSVYVAGNLYIAGNLIGANTLLTNYANVANIAVGDFFAVQNGSNSYANIGQIYVNPVLNVTNGTGTSWSASTAVPSGSYRCLGCRDVTSTSGLSGIYQRIA